MRQQKYSIITMKTSLLPIALRYGLLLLLLAVALLGEAQTPNFMTYQGYLTDQNGNALATNGPQAYDVVFRIWPTATGGATPLYGELQTVTVANGYFSVLLGQGNSYVNGGVPDPRPTFSMVFATNASGATGRYMEMTVKGLASGADVVILPRLQLVSAPYAFMAASANALVSSTTGNTLISSSGSNVTLNGTFAANSLTNTGNFTDLGGGIYLDNAQQMLGKNTAGAYESFLYPRWTDNVTYLNYGSGGFNIRNDSSVSTMWLSAAGNVGIGTISPISSLGYPGGWSGFHAYSGAGNNGLGIIEGSVSARLHLRNDGGTANTTQDFVIDDTANDVYFRWLGGGLGNRVNIMTLDPNGNVGIGTSTPQRLLTAIGPTASPGSDTTYQAGIGTGTKQLILGYDNTDDAGVIAASDYETAWKNVLIAPAGGNVGIGTSAPTSPLQVAGTVTATEVKVDNGQYYAAAGLSQLRIVRGIVELNGTIFNGTGFTVTTNGTGSYTLNFNPAFTDVPTVVVTPAPNATAPVTATWNNGNPNNILIETWSGSTHANVWFQFMAMGGR
jgi:hypothetical protein